VTWRESWDGFKQSSDAKRKTGILGAVLLGGAYWLFSGGPEAPAVRARPAGCERKAGPCFVPVSKITKNTVVTPAGGVSPTQPQPPGAGPLVESTPVAPVVPPAPGEDVFKPLLGQWQGGSMLANRGSGVACGLHIKLLEDPKHDGSVNGYTRLTCAPIGNLGLLQIQSAPCKADPLACMGKLQEKAAPTSAILVGKVSDGALHLEATENIGTAATGCVMRSMVVRDFGTDQVAVTWQDACAGGELVLGRAGN
jgi:hypothetical protein